MAGIDSISNNLANKVDELNSTVHQAIRDGSNAARPAADHFAAGVHHAIDRVTDVANQTVRSLDDTGAQIKSSASHLVSHCSGYVKQKPLTSLGVALAAGFLLGQLVRLRT